MPAKLKRKLPPLDLGNMTIGQRIANFRKNLGLTQKQLAEKMGLMQSIISDYETGRLRLYDEMVARFAIDLNVSSDDLLGLSKVKNNSEKMDLKVTKRLRKIEQLPLSTQKTLLRTIDIFIESSKENNP